jgi:hypothetical protein
VIIPSGLIFTPLFAAFILLSYQYYREDSAVRVRNLRFGLMTCGLLLMIAYLVLYGESVLPALVSPVFFVLALGLLGASVRLLRRMKPRGG